MTQSTGKTGRGVTIEIGSLDSPTTWTALANVTSIAFASRDAAEIDFTTLASDGGFRELRQGFKDPGTISCVYHFDVTNATIQDILARFLSGDLFDFRINYKAIGWNFAEQGIGFVKNPGDRTHDVNNPIQGTTTIRVTGPTAFTGI